MKVVDTLTLIERIFHIIKLTDMKKYIFGENKNTKKRFSEWLEKASVASFAVGIFQKNLLGVVLSLVFLYWSFRITEELGGVK